MQCGEIWTRKTKARTKAKTGDVTLAPFYEYCPSSKEWKHQLMLPIQNLRKTFFKRCFSVYI